MGGFMECAVVIIICVEFVIGILGNGFIALVNGMDWVKRRKISPIDQLLTVLAICRIGLLLVVPTGLWVIVFHPGLLMNVEIMRMSNITWIIANHFNLWFSTNLSIFYFLKIANYANSTFLYLKWRVKKVASVTLLVSLVLLCLNITLINTEIDVWIHESQKNTSGGLILGGCVQCSRPLLLTNAAFILIPSSVSLTAIVLLIFSLWRHQRRMRASIPGASDAGARANVKAMQTMLAFLLVYAVFFLCLIMRISSYELLEQDLTFSIDLATGLSFPSGHSCVLILGDSKLRQASLSVLGWLRCRFQGCGTLCSLIQFKNRQEYS